MDQRPRPRLRPLERRDPPMLGDVMLEGRLADSDAGVVFAGQLVDQPVAVVMLSEGAEADSYARARFDKAVGALHAAGRGDEIVASDRELEVAPWVALASGEPSGDRWSRPLATSNALLAAVTLQDVHPVGQQVGPSFRPHWYRRNGVGRWRLWPIPWPATLTTAGRWTFIASFALMVAIAALALWIVTRIFEDQPPPPTPTVTRNVPPPPPMTLPSPSQPSTSGPTINPPGPLPSGTLPGTDNPPPIV